MWCREYKTAPLADKRPVVAVMEILFDFDFRDGYGVRGSRSISSVAASCVGGITVSGLGDDNFINTFLPWHG